MESAKASTTCEQLSILLFSRGLIRGLSHMATDSGVGKRGGWEVIFTNTSSSYRVNRATGLLCVYVNDAYFGVNLVPIPRHIVENQPKIAAVSRLHRLRRSRLQVHIRIAGSDPFQGPGFVLCHLVRYVPEQNLHRHSRHGPVAVVRDVA